MLACVWIHVLSFVFPFIFQSCCNLEAGDTRSLKSKLQDPVQAKSLTTTSWLLLVMTLFVSFSEQTINLNILDADTYRRFCNKIWQSYKFVLSRLGDSFKPTGNIESCDLVNQWIISRLSHMIRSCDKYFKTYNLQKACKELHGFWLLDFCDTYLVSYSFV